MVLCHLLRGDTLTLLGAKRWRTLDSGAADAVDNMALDVCLMERARETGEAVLRVYAWSRPAVSFGRHEDVRARFDAARLQAEGVSAVRRPTGGRVLWHDREVTYSVSAPSAADAPLSEGYRAINGLLIRAMAGLGVLAFEAPPGSGLRPGGAACFAEPSAGELVVADRKLVGSAQVRTRGAMLQHGSILIADGQARIARFAIAALTPPLPAATLAEALGRSPSYAEVRDALFRALRASVIGVEPLDPAEVCNSAIRYRTRFADPEWTWRR